MGVFENDQSLSRQDLRKTIRDNSGSIPGAGGARYDRSQREKITREVFGSRYGSQISKQDYRSALNSLKTNRTKAKDVTERRDIDKKISFLKGIGGL